jgi:hypothetical protein
MSARKLRWRKDGARNISVEDACWQYILDHSFVHNQQGFVGRFSVKDKAHFLYSLDARKKGKYRFTEEDILNLSTKD